MSLFVPQTLVDTPLDNNNAQASVKSKKAKVKKTQQPTPKKKSLPSNTVDTATLMEVVRQSNLQKIPWQNLTKKYSIRNHDELGARLPKSVEDVNNGQPVEYNSKNTIRHKLRLLVLAKGELLSMGIQPIEIRAEKMLLRDALRRKKENSKNLPVKGYRVAMKIMSPHVSSLYQSYKPKLLSDSNVTDKQKIGRLWRKMTVDSGAAVIKYAKEQSSLQNSKSYDYDLFTESIAKQIYNPSYSDIVAVVSAL